MRLRRLSTFATSVVAVVLCVAATARADRVAMVPTTGSADPEARNALEIELVQNLASLGHTVVPEVETKAALSALGGDGVADTAEEFQGVASATKAHWVVAATLDPAVVTQRVELTAFLASAGRVESVAREVDKARSQQQVREMLAVLVRPEGIGAGALPWEGGPAQQPPPTPQPPATAPTRPPPAVVPPPTPVPAKATRMRYALGDEDVWPPYTAGRAAFVGALTGLSLAASRAEGAKGSSAAFIGALRGGYSFGDTGLELLGSLGGNLAGPPALWLEVAGRWMFSPLSGGRGSTSIPLHVGPLLAMGGFFRLAGKDVERAGVVYSDEGSTHFTMRGSLDVSYGLSDSLRLEAELGDLRWVPGGAGTLVLAGATVGASLRF